MFLHKLPPVKKYLSYIFLLTTCYLLATQGYKSYKAHQSSYLQKEIIHKEVKITGLKKRNQFFSVKNHLSVAFSQYVTSLKGNEDIFYAKVIYRYFSNFISENTDLISSMRNHPPILDKDTYSNLYLFKGPEGNETESYCNKLAQKLGIELALSKYHLFTMLAGANNDPDKIKNYQQIVQRFQSDKKTLYKLRELLSKLKGVEEDLMKFYIRDSVPTQLMYRIKQTIRVDSILQSDIVDFLNKIFNFDMRKQIEEAKFGALFLKIATLHVPDIEALINFNEISSQLKFWFQTLKFIFHDKTIKESERYNIPSFSDGLIDNFINIIYRILAFPFTSLLGISNTNLDLLDQLHIKTGVDYVYLFFATFSVLVKKMVFNPPHIIYNGTFGAYKELIKRHSLYEEAYNDAINLLNQVNTLYKVAKYFDKFIEKDKKLKLLCKPYLKSIHQLAKNKKIPKLRKILKNIKKLPKEPATWEKFWNPFDMEIANALRFVKKLDDLPGEEEEVLISTLVSLCFLDTFLGIATFSLQSNQNKSELNFSPTNILNPENNAISSIPQMNIKGMYSLFLAKNKTIKNDMSNIIDPKTKEPKTIVLLGPNGSGKSMFQKTIQEVIITSQAIGYCFADEANITLVDYIRFISNTNDNSLKELSHMMAVSQKLNQNALQLVDQMEKGEKAFFCFDELAGATPSDEASKWLLSSIAYLQNAHNNTLVISTHLTNLLDLAQNARYNNLAPYTPGFHPDKGFTYKIEPGSGEYPVSIHVLKKINFHPVVLKNMIRLLAEDKNYRFRNKLKIERSKSLFDHLFNYPRLEKYLLILLILLMGILIGSLLPILPTVSIPWNRFRRKK